MTELLAHLEALRGSGRKLLVPYLMTGIPDKDSFPEVYRAVAAGADAIEVGLPFSDPLMDGPVIAAAGERVIRAGIGPLDALELAGAQQADPPRIVMTYYNPIHRIGESEFCRRAADAGTRGLIVPDLPMEESEALRRAAAEVGIAWIPLVAPTSSPERVAAISATATGFVYAVSSLGVTGARDSLASSAAEVVRRIRVATDAPVLIGIGISDAAQAAAAAMIADGVVVGSAVVRVALEDGAAAAGALVAGMRVALDG
ncbi:MAG: tryptophan synthase subunit alpha [Actinomycetota bacterium]